MYQHRDNTGKIQSFQTCIQAKSKYLHVINNERNYNQTLYDNFVSINKLVLVYSTNDKIIHPPISGLFGFYDENINILQFNKTDMYQKDLFGLKKLYQEDKIVFYQNVI